MQRTLLRLATVAEILTGLVLLIAPTAASGLLFGAGPDNVGLMIGRLAGLALLALGMACWGAARNGGGAAQAGTLRAITVYNVGAGLLLVAFAATGQAGGIGVWSAGALHLALRLVFAASLRRPLEEGR